MKNDSWFVYIIQNEKGFLYTGITTDIARRFHEHRLSKKGAKFFRAGAPLEVLYSRSFPNRSLASKFEAQIKRMKREDKIHLVETGEVRSDKTSL